MIVKKYNQGFTLIETIISLSIFILVLIIGMNIYLIVTNTQHKVATMQRIQGDVRFMFEAMAQEIRLGSINYAFYADAANGINLHPVAGGDTNNILALLDQTNSRIFFRLSASSRVQYCEEISAGDCDVATGTGWQDITPAGVEILDLRFLIMPSADPFIEVTQQACNTSSECTAGYECNTSVCEYYSDGGNFQPKVRIFINSRGTGKSMAEESEILMQTTVSSRILPSVVKNENYDLP